MLHLIYNNCNLTYYYIKHHELFLINRERILNFASIDKSNMADCVSNGTTLKIVYVFMRVSALDVTSFIILAGR